MKIPLLLFLSPIINHKLERYNKISNFYSYQVNITFQNVIPPLNKKLGIQLINNPLYKIKSFNMKLLDKIQNNNDYILYFSSNIILENDDWNSDHNKPLGFLKCTIDNKTIESDLIVLPL